MAMYSCKNTFGGLARRRFWAGAVLVAGMLIGGGVQATQLTMSALPNGANPTLTPGDTNITTSVGFSIRASDTDPRYSFSYWLLEGCSNSAPFTTTNNASTTIKVNTNAESAWAVAVYTENTRRLIVSASPAAGGTTDPTGTNLYLKGTDVLVSESPALGYEFTGWTGAAFTPLPSNSVRVTVSLDPTVLTANFIKLWSISQTFRNGPSDGTPYVYTARNGVNLTIPVPSVIAERIGNRRYRCNGWSGGTGSVIPGTRSGAAYTTVYLQPLSADSSWAWDWVAQCKVDVTNTASGFITIEELGAPSDNDTDDHWVDSGTSIRVTLTSNDPSKTEPDYLLVGGVRYDLSALNQVDLLITDPVSLVPVFRVSSQDDPGFIAFMRRSGLLAGSVGQRTFDDPDNDGLSNGEEYLLSNTNKSWYYSPINSDTDGDGMDDAYEAASVDPTNITAEAQAKLKPAATDNGGYRFDSGAEGNSDNDFHWSTTDGYLQRSRPLINIEEYRGPDGTPPWTNVVVRFGETYIDVNGTPHPYPFASNPVNSRPDVWIRVPVAGDTDDQSKGNTDSSDRDTFDDGFEYSWDRWQHWDYTNAVCLTNGVDEVLLIGVTNGMAIYFTNTIPDWATARVFNPAHSDSVSDGPEYDVLYDYLTGKVSQHYFGAVREYNVWKLTALTQGVGAAPHRIRMDSPPDGDANPQRCSHPFLWDVDQDGLPDGYEVIFGYDPWSPRTSGSALPDGQENPDDDWMAKISTNTLSLRNHEVYVTNGFDTRVAWAQVYPARNQMVGPGTSRAPTTERYSNVDEMWGPDGIMVMIPVAPGSGVDDATHAFKPDTDGDGIWDGWENYVGLDASLGGDAGLDIEDDKLSNLAEFQSFVTSSTNRQALLPVPDWNNKLFPTDPRDDDTDGDRLGDGGEKALFNGTSVTATNLVIDFVTELVVTQVFTVGTWNGAAYTSGGLNPTSSDTDGDTFPDPYEACYGVSPGMDGTQGDTFEDPDNDLVPNYLEYYSCSVYHWQYDAWGLHATNTMYDSGDFYGGAAGGTPKLWDWSQTLYNPLLGEVGRFGYSGATPNLVDSDTDGMDDFYEIYHGLNPAYGVLDLVVSKYLNFPIPITSPFSGPVVADPRALPYVNGSPFMDSDGDGLPNSEEGVNLLNPERSPQYHTDPSPLWITDMDYPNSWVNLYYTPGSFWPWSGILPPPIYAYDFEINEGFDTDNDGYSDREELVVMQTDPLTPERPVKRRALYLPPGQPAYARTFPGYSYLDDSLRSFTVEAWIRPINPTSGVNQVVVERPIMVPFGNPMYVAGVRVNFRLGVDPAGSPYVAYHGEGMEAIFYVAKASAASRVSAANWTHLCGTYQVPAATNPDQRGVLTLYVNGQMAAQTNPDELPAHARFGNGDLVFQYGAPIVIGASDANPAGDMNVFTLTPSPAPFDFFKGWVDEVRVWDGARSQGQVVNSMMRRMKQADVIASQATVVPLLYLYSFDALPDPDHTPTAPAGLGFDVTGNAIFPSDWPYVYFWGTEPSRSQVYAGLGGGDPRYLPWIENAVAHVPLVPPVDIGDPNVLQNVMNGTNIVGQTLPFRNTTNPYGYRHITYPALIPEITEGFILYNDLLPLAWAAADEDIAMWDGGGVPAVDPFDTDGDGMPDDWEEAHGFNPLDPNGDNGPDADIDGDGLSNYYEYLCGTDPKAIISSNGNIPDGELDSDGDRLNNLQELQHGTMPNMKDTDDDGLTDWEELNGTVDITWVRPATSQAPATRSDPLNPLSPAVQRAVYLDGDSRLIVPPSDKLMAKNWTVEMWVNPATNGTGGVLASRYVGGLSASEYGITYEVGLTTNSVPGGMVRPYVRFLMTTSGVPVETRLDGLGATEMTNGLHAVTFPQGVWTHVAGTFNSVSNIMSVYVNGALASYRTDASSLPPLLYGYGTGHRNDEVTIGASRSIGPVAGGFKGYLDNVRIWSITRTAEEIADRYNAPEGVPSGSGTLTLKTGTINVTGGVSHEVAQQPGSVPIRVLVKFDSESSATELASLAAAGVQVLNYVAPGVRAVKATPQQLTALGTKVTWAGLLNSGNKISPLVSGSGAVGNRKVLVSFFKDVVEGDALLAAAAVGGTVYNNRYIAGSDMVVTVNEQQLQALAARNEVAWVAPAAEFLTSGRPIHRLSSHVVGGVEVAPFAVVGDGWDGPGKGSADLTYHFINYNSNLAPAVAKKAVVDPMFKWAQYASLTFTETTQAGRPYSMDILWEQIDGPSGILGFGYFPNDINPESVAGDFHLDSEETWTIGPQPGGIDLEYVALHEQGHCLGLGHSDDPTAIMYPYYDGARDATLAPDDIAAIQSIYGKQVAMGTLAEFRFDDGGDTAQDFTVPHDWRNGWASAATLVGAVFVTNTTPPLNKDSDGDGLPDWWEMVFGLDPYDANEMNSANGDPDGDGLSNAAEYQAGTDPLRADTKRTGSTDFYAWDDLHTNVLYRYRTYGELYTDHDGMDDWWEQTHGLDPRNYDSNLDQDEDGWSNLAEFQSQTDPQFVNSAPQPALIADVSFNGVDPFGLLTIETYSRASMDGAPDARFEQDIQAVNVVDNEYLATAHRGQLHYEGRIACVPIVPGTLTITFAENKSTFWAEVFTGVLDANGTWTFVLNAPYGSTGTIDWYTGEWSIDLNAAVADANWDMIDGKSIRADYTSNIQGSPYPFLLRRDWPEEGNVREGDNWMFAYIDRNQNGKWDEGEPAGMAEGQPIDVRYGTVDVKFGLTETLPGYQRFAWTAQSNQTAYLVRVDNLSMGGALVFSTTIRAPRTYLQEQDYRNAGVFGLPFAPNFSAKVFAQDGVTIVATNSFNVSYYPASVAVPESVYPVGAVLHYARNEFQWRMDTNATAFNLVIKAGSTNSAALLNITNVPTFREADGTTRFRLPIYAGDGAFTNGVYYWQVRSLNARANSTFSDWRSFRVELDDHPQGPWSIMGDVVYAGKVTNRSFRVQAYASPGFGGTPLAQSTLANATVPTAWPLNRMHYVLQGLPAGQYYVRSFLDQNSNGKKEIWESSGFMSSNTIYQTGYLTLPTSVDSKDVYVMIADIDNDKLADDWEYQYYTNLTSAGPGPLRGYTVSASSTNINVYECYAASPLNMSPVNPDIVGLDGLPLRMKDAFGLDVWSPYAFVISSMRMDETGHPTVSWPALSSSGVAAYGVGASVSLASGGVTLRYQLQYTEDLVTWQDVPARGTVTYDTEQRVFRFTDVPSTLGTARCYRYKVMWE